MAISVVLLVLSCTLGICAPLASSATPQDSANPTYVGGGPF
jgi:hypothetical protein